MFRFRSQGLNSHFDAGYLATIAFYEKGDAAEDSVRAHKVLAIVQEMPAMRENSWVRGVVAGLIGVGC